MSSSIYEESSTESLSIPKLMQVMESSLREYENGQANAKIELEKLKKERESNNQEVVSLKNIQGLMKLDMLKLQHELCTSEEQSKKYKMQMEEHKNQEKKLKELYEKVCDENSKMTIQQGKLASDTEKNKQLVDIYKKKSDLFGKRLEEMEIEKSKLVEKLSRSEMNCKEQGVRITGLLEEESNLKKRFEGLIEEKLKAIKENETKKQKIWELEQQLEKFGNLTQQLEKYQSLNGRVEKLEKEIDGMLHDKLAAQTKEFGEERFDGRCEGHQGSATGSKRKRRLVRAMLSAASEDIIQKPKPIRRGGRGDSLTNLTAKRRNICRSAERKFSTGEKVSESLESTPASIGCLKGGSTAKPISSFSLDTLPCFKILLAEKAQSSGIIKETLSNQGSKNCGRK